MIRKVCIYGAGAIGGWIGVRLARAGCEVSVVARGATLDALNANGLRLQTGGETLTAKVRASASPLQTSACRTSSSSPSRRRRWPTLPRPSGPCSAPTPSC